MKQYVVSAIVSVDDVCDGRRPDADMLQRLIKEYCKTGKYNQPLFRGRAIMDIKDIQTMVTEVKDFSSGEGAI